MWRLTTTLRLAGRALYAFGLAVVWTLCGLLILVGSLLTTGLRLVGYPWSGSSASSPPTSTRGDRPCVSYRDAGPRGPRLGLHPYCFRGAWKREARDGGISCPSTS